MKRCLAVTHASHLHNYCQNVHTCGQTFFQLTEFPLNFRNTFRLLTDRVTRYFPTVSEATINFYVIFSQILHADSILPPFISD